MLWVHYNPVKDVLAVSVCDTVLVSPYHVDGDREESQVIISGTDSIPNFSFSNDGEHIFWFTGGQRDVKTLAKFNVTSGALVEELVDVSVPTPPIHQTNCPDVIQLKDDSIVLKCHNGDVMSVNADGQQTLIFNIPGRYHCFLTYSPSLGLICGHSESAVFLLRHLTAR